MLAQLRISLLDRSSLAFSNSYVGIHLILKYLSYICLFSVTGSPALPTQNGDKPVRLLAKYNYQCNPNRSGGFDELTVTQGEKLEFSRAHPTNPHWWEARNDNGDIGFVPATYMMVSVRGRRGFVKTKIYYHLNTQGQKLTL